MPRLVVPIAPRPFTHNSGTSTLNGNITGGSANNAPACAYISTGTLIINGNSTGGSGATAYGITNAAAGTVIVNGTVTGGSANGAYGLFNNSTGTATATAAIAGSAVTAYGIMGNNLGGTTKVKSFQSSSAPPSFLLDLQDLGLLCLMGVFAPSVDSQLFHLRLPQTRLGHHPLDRFIEHAVRKAAQLLTHRAAF